MHVSTPSKTSIEHLVVSTSAVQLIVVRCVPQTSLLILGRSVEKQTNKHVSYLLLISYI